MLKRISKALVKSTDVLFAGSKHPERGGSLVKLAEAKFPKDQFPAMWIDIPDDLKTSPWWFGRLPNGGDPAETCFSDISEQSVVNVAHVAGRKALKLTALLAAGVSLIAFPFIERTWSLLPSFPSWALEKGAYGALMLWTLQAVSATLWTCGSLAITYGWPLALLFPVLWWNGFVGGMNRLWNSLSWRRRLPTIDYHVYSESELMDARQSYVNYSTYVMDAVTRLKDESIFEIGTATGIMHRRNVPGAPLAGSPICIDSEQIRRHIWAEGPTGIGKTYLFIKPMFYRVVIEAKWAEGRKIGAYVTDGKGVLASQLMDVVGHRKDEVRVVGIKEGEYGVDLLAGMKPGEFRDTMQKVQAQMSAGGSNQAAFWEKLPLQILYHAARLALAVETDSHLTNAFKGLFKAKPYSLFGIYMLTINLPVLKTYMGAVTDLADAQPTNVLLQEAKNACQMLLAQYVNQPPETRENLSGTISALLGDTFDDGIGVAERFFYGTYPAEKCVDVEHALNGGILMVAMGAAGAGLSSGHLAAIWMKARLMNRAVRRQQEDPDAAANNWCCMIADEFQLLATVGKGADDATADSGFWNISRSTGVFLICASQNFSSLAKAVGGRDNADVILQNMSTKIIFETDTDVTADYYIKLAGETKIAPSTFEGIFTNQEHIEAKYPETGVTYGTSLAACLLPSVHETPTAQHDLIDLSWYWAANEAMPYERRESNATIIKYGKDQLRAIKDSAHKQQAALNVKDLRMGNGHAFVWVKRGKGTRFDMAKLSPL